MNDSPRNLSLRKYPEGLTSSTKLQTRSIYKQSEPSSDKPRAVSSSVYIGQRSNPGIHPSSISQELLAQLGYSNLLAQSYYLSQQNQEERISDSLPRKPFQLEESVISHLLPREPLPQLPTPQLEANLSHLMAPRSEANLSHLMTPRSEANLSHLMAPQSEANLSRISSPHSEANLSPENLSLNKD